MVDVPCPEHVVKIRLTKIKRKDYFYIQFLDIHEEFLSTGKWVINKPIKIFLAQVYSDSA